MKSRHTILALLYIALVGLVPVQAEATLVVQSRGSMVKWAVGEVRAAKSSIHLVTDKRIAKALVTELQLAFRRGVDVRVIVRSPSVVEFYRENDPPVYEARLGKQEFSCDGLWLDCIQNFELRSILEFVPPNQRTDWTIDTNETVVQLVTEELAWLGQFGGKLSSPRDPVWTFEPLRPGKSRR